MTEKTLIKGAAFLMLLLAILILGPEKTMCGGLFLVDGVGLEGKLEIGMPAPPQARELNDQSGWYGLDDLPIYFKITTDRHVVMIRCDNYCLTNRSISIGSRVQEVLRTYGKPLAERSIEGKKFLEYRGVGFALNAQGNAVGNIFILPMSISERAR
jgi:hypothetical protein